jgi:hypothetical protein
MYGPAVLCNAPLAVYSGASGARPDHSISGHGRGDQRAPANRHAILALAVAREMENHVALDPWPLAEIDTFRQAQR